MTADERTRRAEVPKAVVHKQILDAAAEHPDRSIQELASEVSSATAVLVERVLDEYGDPGREQEGPEETSASGPAGTATDGELTRTQRETLRLVYEHPTASQRELAEMLDVSHTAVYNQLQAVEGFDWENRWEFVTDLFGCPAGDCPAIDAASEAGERGPSETGESSSSVFEDADLVQKLIRVCVETDAITDEELQVIVDDFIRRTTGEWE